MSEPVVDLPVTTDTVDAAYEAIYAPWVRRFGLRNLEVSEGWATALLAQDSELQFFSGAVCGQAIMAAIDTVAVLAMVTTDRPSQGTASQNTHLLRPATGTTTDHDNRSAFRQAPSATRRPG